MGKYLKEIDLLASNLYFEKKDKFRKESCCFMYLLDDLLQKKVPSNFQKIAVKLWPVGQFQGEDVERYIPDTISNVFVIEKEYDMDEYYKHDELSERNNEILRLLKESFSNIPQEYKVDKIALSQVFAEAEESDGIYRKESGRWVSSPDKSMFAKLWVEYNSDEILFGVKFKNKSDGKEYKKVFAEFDPFNAPVLYELGKIEFCGERTIKYSPQKHFQAITFEI